MAHRPRYLLPGSAWQACPESDALYAVTALEEPALILTETRRLQLHIDNSDQAKLWLANAGTAGQSLDFVVEAALAAPGKQQCNTIAKILGWVKQPEAAIPMLRLREESSASGIAETWFDAHPQETLLGLAPLLVGKHPQEKNVVAVLRRLNKMHPELITNSIAACTAEIQTALQAQILNVAEVQYQPLGDVPWFVSAVAAVKKTKLPAWADPVLLPPLLLGGLKLSDAQNHANPLRPARQRNARGFPALAAQQGWTPSVAMPLPGSVPRLVHRRSRCPTALAMESMSWLGGDLCVQKLMPLLRAWPGESQHKRAVAGLEVLRRMGSEYALMQFGQHRQKTAVSCAAEKSHRADGGHGQGPGPVA